MKWFVRLQGHRFDLEDLPDWLEGGEVNVQEDDGEYYLTSHRFDALANPGEVRRAATDFVNLLNGLGRIHQPGFEPISAGVVETRSSDGSKKVHISSTSRGRSRDKARVTINDQDGIEKPHPNLGRLRRWVDLAERDELVERAIGYLNGSEITWNDLYCALEVVKSDVEGDVPGASNSQLTRFRHTANSYSVLGYEARHGKDNWEPPENPMPFDEALGLIRGVIKRWIQEKLEN